MPARPLHQRSGRETSGKPVNKFAPPSHTAARPGVLLRVQAQRPLDFAGAGRRRSADDARRAAAERQQDGDTLQRLRAYGLPAAIRPQVDFVDLASMGTLSERRDELPRWCVFANHVRREQAEAHGLLGAYVAEHKPHRIAQLRLRRYGSPILVRDLRAFHLKDSCRVGRLLEYVATWPGVTPLARSVHHRPIDRGALIDHHHHIAVQLDAATAAERAEIIARLLRYCVRTGYDAWVADEGEAILGVGGSETAESAQALAVYLRESTARHVEQFSDGNLAEYVRQVYYPAPLHRWQPLGPLRRLAAKLRADGVRPWAEDDGCVTLRPITSARAQRRRDAAWVAAGPCVLALRIAWVGDELRAVAVVRGWRGDWAELARRYDLDAAVQAARDALAGTSSYTTVIPESSPPTAPPPTQSPPAPSTSPPDDDAVPW